MQKATGSYRTYSLSGKTVALLPEFAVETCLRENCNLDFCFYSEGPALGLKTYDDDIDPQLRACQLAEESV